MALRERRRQLSMMQRRCTFCTVCGQDSRAGTGLSRPGSVQDVQADARGRTLLANNQTTIMAAN